MMTEGTFKIPAIEDEPSTKRSAPLISSTKPISKSKYIIKMTSLKNWAVQ
jgi:ATP/ADP translocase